MLPPVRKIIEYSVKSSILLIYFGIFSFNNNILNEEIAGTVSIIGLTIMASVCLIFTTSLSCLIYEV